jgi:hypothetical protein
MRKKLLIVSSISLMAWIAVLLPGCDSNAPVQKTSETPATEKAALSDAELLVRGKHLVTTIGCNHCHTPKKMGPQGPVLDSARLLSGHQAGSPLPLIDKKALTPGYWVLFAGDLTVTVGPWGISYSANLTPDSITGIGAWTEEVFVKTIRTGKHLGLEGGRPIMPPMPWESIGELSDVDLKALYTFLRAIPAVSNQVPAYQPPNEVAKTK